uniref:BZIP domain-containing protein n=1 Tax=Panagrolaimus superbus TaxID=310955 RepID=A0A914XS69_9BILA
MVPGSVTFHSITNQVFEFNVATSKLFSNSANFDLVIRVRCVRTKISDTSTLIKLLCDPKSGNVENVPTASRYCQKVKWNAKKVSKKVEKTNQSPNFLFQKDDNEKDVEIDATKIEKSFTNGPNADIPELSCKSIGLSNNSRDLEEENAKTMELFSNISEERRKSESKRIGRPKRYETKEECKKARAEASKKYSLKKSREFDKMKEAVISMEKTNEYLNEKLENLALQFAENPRNEIPNLPKHNFIENLTNSNDSSKNDSQADKNVKPNTKQTDNDKFDKLSSHEKRREQQRLAVQRVRERRKAEEKQLYVRKELCQKQNEELKEKIESINKLMEWLKKSTDDAAKSFQLCKFVSFKIT